MARKWEGFFAPLPLRCLFWRRQKKPSLFGL